MRGNRTYFYKFLTVKILLFFTFFASTAQIKAENPFFISFLKNEEKPFSVEEISKKTFENEQLAAGKANFSFGFSQAEYWFKINVPPHPNKLILKIPFPVLDSVNFYAKDEGGFWQEMQAGDCQPFRKRVIPFHQAAFPIEAKDERGATYYLKIKSEGSLTIPVELCTASDFFYDGFLQELLLGTLFGAVLVLALLNICFYLFFRQKIALFLGIKLLFALYFLLNLNGYFQVYFLGEKHQLANYSMLLSLILYAGAMSFYTFHAAGLEGHAPKMKFFLKFLTYFAALQIPLVLVLPFNICIQSAIILGIISAFFSFFSYMLSRVRGYAQVRYAVTGAYVYIIGIFITSLKFFGILEKTFFSEFGIEAGVLMQAILFTVTAASLNNDNSKL